MTNQSVNLKQRVSHFSTHPIFSRTFENCNRILPCQQKRVHIKEAAACRSVSVQMHAVYAGVRARGGVGGAGRAASRTSRRARRRRAATPSENHRWQH